MSYFVTNTTKKEHHSEGDVWEESGKTWTIKKGIKKSMGKLDSFRKEMIMPLACTKCGTAMKSEIHKPLWQVYRKCLNCVIDMEHEINNKGKWIEYQTALIKANMEGRYKDLEDFIEAFTSDTSSSNYVTESGVVESWVDNTKEVAKKVGKEVLTNYKKEVDKLKEDGDEHS